MTFTTTDAEPLADLNPAQREAVLHFEGPLLILAGAGSGKTRVLTRRIARLIEHHGVDPKHILAVTFTNKAASEMRDRIERLLGEEPKGMWMGTFHSIGARMLRAAAHLAGRSANFTIYDPEDSLGVIKRLMETHRISPKNVAPRAIQATISDAKNALVTPAEFEAVAKDPFTKSVAPVFRDYEPAMRQNNAVDFDDLLVLPVEMLRKNEDRLAQYRERFQFILVDEYQDTNRAQYQLVRLLGGEHGNVAVVGDDDQSIYGWRGADIRNILDFEKDFPSATVVRLEENYRSTPEILSVANAVIQGNPTRKGKTLRPTLPSGERVVSVATLDDRDEADWVGEEIAARRATGHSLGDVAILYRTNAQSRPMEEALRRRGMPYRLIGAVRFYDRREIRDLMAYLKLIANPSDDESFRRAVGVPKRGLGETTIEQLAERAAMAGTSLLAAASQPEMLESVRPAARGPLADFAALIERLRQQATEASVDELLRDLVDEIRYGDYLRSEGPESAERLDNVRELITGATEVTADEGGEVGLTPLDHFLQRASLIAATDQSDPDADAVTMMTLHNAKGLEFPVVFVTGLEDGLFPLAKAFDDPAMLEEERRLLYVGVTRAEKALYLTHARSRRRNGETMPSIPSSFLKEIPAELLEQRTTMKLRATGRAAAPISPGARRPGTPWVRRMPEAAPDEEASQDAPRFVKGERVRHARFGSGTIAELSGVGKETKVTVDFDDESVGRKRLVVAYAGLERGWD